MVSVFGRSVVRTTSTVVAAVFLLVGILGFVPGVTTGTDMMNLWGHDSHAMLLGVFQVSVLHNIVHLAFGLAGLAMSATAGLARGFLIGGGIVYLALWIYGIVIDQNSAANFVPVNAADNWLHLALGVGMVLLGALLGGKGSGEPAR